MRFGFVAEEPVIRRMGPELLGAGLVTFERLLLRVGLSWPPHKRIAANARTDRFKADFIASLPMRLSWPQHVIYLNVSETNFFVCSPRGLAHVLSAMTAKDLKV